MSKAFPDEVIYLSREELKKLEEKAYLCERCSEIYLLVKGSGYLFKPELKFHHLYVHFLWHLNINATPDLNKVC